jgi:hypothetical protein
MAKNNSINNNASVFTSDTSITSTLGNITATQGDLISTLGNITATHGNITATLGDIVLTNGKLSVGGSTGTAGQVLIAATGANPAWASVTAGANITLTPGVNTLTIAASGGMPFADATADFTLVVNNGYNINHATPANKMLCTLPATASLGDRIEIVGSTSGGWKVVQGANQYCRLGNQVSTTGAAGYLEFTNQYDSIELTCIVAGASTGWRVTKAVGNITVA